VKQSLDPSPLNLDKLFPFELDEFQQEAITALTEGKSVVICAPTGSGKTVIGEYAIYHALERGKRVFYTTPLKALSNQKFRNFQDKFCPELDQEEQNLVGLITGDIVINANASIVIMTTEIFRNMLYRTPIGQVGTSLENVATVILDECHYISNRDRGTVWEESIIYCSPTIQLVALSATIGNPKNLTNWINQIRKTAPGIDLKTDAVSLCKLINSNFRPVPLRFYFSSKTGLSPLLNQKQNALNPCLKSKGQQNKKKRLKREDCPNLITVIRQLYQEDLLPAIYVIFSRRGCDQSVQKLDSLTLVSSEESHALQYNLLTFFLSRNLPLQQNLLQVIQIENPLLYQPLLNFLSNLSYDADLFDCLRKDEEAKIYLFQLLAKKCQLVRSDQLEPLTRGIAAHHAGILPVWKELVEQLFEAGLVKVVFATATLSAGINMPARTTVISALSKRTDVGHSMLTPSEFLQIAGRAGRRGMDKVGYVITVQTPFEGAKEAAYLATAELEPLKSCFTPSYGMVLNLLQKQTLDQAKHLLERSFAEYLAQLELEPEKRNIASLTTELTKVDIDLAGLTETDLFTYEKLKARLKEEQRLLKILQQQAEKTHRQKISPQLDKLNLGALLYLKGKRLKLRSPHLAVLVAIFPGSGKSDDYLCLGEDNYWYRVKRNDVVDISETYLPLNVIKGLNLPDLDTLPFGKSHKGDENSAKIHSKIRDHAFSLKLAPELIEQQQRINRIQEKIDSHPFSQQKNPTRLLKLHRQRLKLREQLHISHVRFHKLQSRQSYYWEEFLNLIDILGEFKAFNGHEPTTLGQVCATIRGENELWLGLVIMSGSLEGLESHHLAAVVSAVITETLRPDTWTNYSPSPKILNVFNYSDENKVSLREIRRLLCESQSRYDITIPVWLGLELTGVIEQWALGTDWQELCNNTSLDEGDLVRLLRRTIDLLLQIPQIPNISSYLKRSAKDAVTKLKRFPI
jgi:superfamily II RNA helicase